MFQSKILLTGLLLLAFVFCNAHADTIKVDSVGKNKLFAIPIFGYTPETSWFFGAGGIYSVRLYPQSKITNPSLINAVFIYTLNKQVLSSLTTNIYTKDNLYLLNNSVSFYKYPDYFFGIGNYTSLEDTSSYNDNFFNLSLNAQRKISGPFYAGIRTFFEHTEITNIEDESLLDVLEIPGEDGGLNTGVGLWLTYDSRDNIYYPLKGIFIDAYSVVHTDVLGSDYNYVDNTVEASTFINTFREQVLGFNFLGRFLPGETPFYHMARLGGDNMLRGNFEGRFRDKYYLAFQTEYRIPIWRFIGANVFGGIGEVAPNMDAFTLSGLKYSAGGGLRIYMNADKLCLRLDYGFGADGDRNFYIKFNEAF